MPEEPQLNGRIASIINKLTNSADWKAREELGGFRSEVGFTLIQTAPENPKSKRNPL